MAGGTVFAATSSSVAAPIARSIAVISAGEGPICLLAKLSAASSAANSASASIASGRARLITGRALDVFPRLTDSGYDLVFCDAAKAEYSDYLPEAVRLLRPGGIVAFDNALWHGRVPDPSNRDSETVAVRELLRQVHDDERLTPVLLNAGDGLLAAVRRA